jgi:hypothetical protein
MIFLHLVYVTKSIIKLNPLEVFIIIFELCHIPEYVQRVKKRWIIIFKLIKIMQKRSREIQMRCLYKGLQKTYFVSYQIKFKRTYHAINILRMFSNRAQRLHNTKTFIIVSLFFIIG